MKKTQIPTAPYVPHWIVERRAPENQLQKPEDQQHEPESGDLPSQQATPENAQAQQPATSPQGQAMFAPPAGAMFAPPQSTPPKDDLNGNT